MESAERDSLVMPPRAESVTVAIDRLATKGLRSQLLKLDERTMLDLCLRLTDRKSTVKAAHEWLNEELGGTADEEIVDKNAVYRFADNFCPIYEQVRSEAARYISRLTVAHATRGNTLAMTRVAQHRLVEVAAEALIKADTIEDLGKQSAVVLAAVRNAQRHDLEEREIERRLRETEAKLELAEQRERQLRLDNQERQRRIDAAGAKAKNEVIEKAAKSGGQVSRDDVLRMIDAVMRGEPS